MSTDVTLTASEIETLLVALDRYDECWIDPACPARLLNDRTRTRLTDALNRINNRLLAEQRLQEDRP